MAPRTPIAALAALALLAGCGPEKVDVDSYTCGEFADSFRDKDDTSAGNFIRGLADRVKKRPGATEDGVQAQVGAAVAIACRGKPKDFKPAPAAVDLVNKAPGKPTKPVEKPKTTTDDDTSPEPETTDETTTTEP